ncbi:MAG: YMGG-like glycine zipper-containing protein [Verrucomicrobiota bacterium]
MKTTLSLCIALLAAASTHAQVFRPEAARGAILGGIAGGVIGHNSGSGNGWRGAAIGSAAGLLIGQAVGDARADRGYRDGGYVYRSSPSVSVGIGVGYGHGYHGRGHHGHGHYHGGYRGYNRVGWGISYAPSYSYYRGYSDWDYPYVYRPAPVVVQQAQPQIVQAPAAPAPVQQAAPQQVTIINNYYNSSPMTSANSLFGR